MEPSGWKKTISYFFHPIMIVDFLALAPYYFRTAAERLPSNLAGAGMLRALRIIRIFRVAPLYMHMVVVTRGVVLQSENPTFMRCFDLKILFNALRLGDYAAGAPLFFTTIRASAPAIMMSIIAMLCMTMMFGTGLYMAERGRFQTSAAYPNGAYLLEKSATDRTLVEGAHTNIFMSMWYIISDTTTSKCLRKRMGRVCLRGWGMGVVGCWAGVLGGWGVGLGWVDGRTDGWMDR